MFGTILLWLATIFTIIWTINWIIHRSTSRGHFWAIVEVVFMWGLVICFFLNPNISRLHLLWAAPLVFLLGFLVSALFMRLSRGG